MSVLDRDKSRTLLVVRQKSIAVVESGRGRGAHETECVDVVLVAQWTVDSGQCRLTGIGLRMHTDEDLDATAYSKCSDAALHELAGLPEGWKVGARSLQELSSDKNSTKHGIGKCLIVFASNLWRTMYGDHIPRFAFMAWSWCLWLSTKHFGKTL